MRYGWEIVGTEYRPPTALQQPTRPYLDQGMVEADSLPEAVIALVSGFGEMDWSLLDTDYGISVTVTPLAPSEMIEA